MDPQTSQPVVPLPGSTPQDDRQKLVQIARGQRGVILVLLAQLAFYAASYVLRGIPFGPIVVLGGWLVLGVLGVVFTFRFASALHGNGTAILCSILLFLPCVGLLTLAVLNSGATSRLRKGGFSVGFLGADPEQVPAPPR